MNWTGRNVLDGGISYNYSLTPGTGAVRGVLKKSEHSLCLGT